MLERRRKGGMLAKISAIFFDFDAKLYVVFFDFDEKRKFLLSIA